MILHAEDRRSNMKKLVSLLLVAALALGAPAAFAEEGSPAPGSGEPMNAQPLEAGPETPALVPYDYDDITVGNPTPLNGQFFTDLWGNATSDTDVRHLVTGYNLVTWDGGISRFRFDHSVVSGAMATDDADGNRTYVLTLYSDLFYSNGTPIRAWDYAFSVLLQCSPLIGELGGRPAVCDFLMGYEDYAAGKTPFLSGVQVPTDNIIAFTVKKEALPYFYELSRLAFYPYPIQAIAPGCSVRDDGSGAYISGLNVGLLRETILDPENGYLSHPDPVSGPYTIQSYSGDTAVFEINPFYKGNEAGSKPRISRITYTLANSDTMIQALGDGSFALLNKVAKASAISEGLQLCADNSQYTRSNYPRVGLTYLFFNPEARPVQENNVRQAIAYCFDRQQFIQDAIGEYSLEMEGLYGLGQWMYNAVSGAIDYPGQLPENATAEETAAYEKSAEAWDSLSLDGLARYSLNVEEAARLLDEAGWTLNEQGRPFDPSADAVRCKSIDGKLVRLELALGFQPLTGIEQAFTACFKNHLAQAGIQLTLSPLDFDVIVKAHNEHQFGSLDLLFFGDNFNISFDPALFFWGEGEAEEDSLFAAYRELSALSENMDRTEPSDVLGYLQKWVLFQERLSSLLPILPVYSNLYFDFYTRELTDYFIEKNISWAKAIVSARMHSLTAEEDGSEAVDYASGALARFPESVRSQIPAGFNTIYEFVAAEMNAETDGASNAVTTEYAFQTPYADGEEVYLLFGIPGKGSDVDWFVRAGKGLQNGNIQVELDKDLRERLAGVTFALGVVSR